VLAEWRPGATVTISGQNIVFSVHASKADGKLMPPGDVTIRAGVNATVWQINGWGNDSGSVDGVVTRIALS
jgi:hypothetical protein